MNQGQLKRGFPRPGFNFSKSRPLIKAWLRQNPSTRENRSYGLCFRNATPALTGYRVNGGFYGDQPSMTKLVAGDLTVTTDFRDIYGTIIEGVLKSPASDVLGKWSRRRNFLRSA